MSVPRPPATRLAVRAPTRCWEQPAQRACRLQGDMDTGKQVWAPWLASRSPAPAGSQQPSHWGKVTLVPPWVTLPASLPVSEPCPEPVLGATGAE